jgi:hypothetical protein
LRKQAIARHDSRFGREWRSGNLIGNRGHFTSSRANGCIRPALQQDSTGRPNR